MKIALRPVEKKDLPGILQWRNCPEIRRMMFSTKIITKREHARFWNRRLTDRKQYSFVVLCKETPVGTVRLDKKEGNYEVDILISPSMQGKGIGKIVLSKIIKIAKARKIGKLSARITPTNIASRRIFEDNDFREKYSYYERDLKWQE